MIIFMLVPVFYLSPATDKSTHEYWSSLRFISMIKVSIWILLILMWILWWSLQTYDFCISPHSFRDFGDSITGWGWVVSKRCFQNFKSLFMDKQIRYMHNESLFCLHTVKKLPPDHIEPPHRADALDSKLCYSKFLPPLMVLGSRQSPLYNQDLNFQINFKNKVGVLIPDKKLLRLPNLKN